MRPPCPSRLTVVPCTFSFPSGVWPPSCMPPLSRPPAYSRPRYARLRSQPTASVAFASALRQARTRVGHRARPPPCATRTARVRRGASRPPCPYQGHSARRRADPGWDRVVIYTPKSPRDLIDEKIARDGLDVFRGASLADFLAASGHRLDREGLAAIARHLADAGAPRYLPAISSALKDLADDSGEFAALVADTTGRMSGDLAEAPLADALADVGSARPEVAVRLARRLIKTDRARHAAFLVGGAARELPEECGSIADTLVRSEREEEAAAGILSLRIAWKRYGIADAGAAIEALAPVTSRPDMDGGAAAEAMDALVDLHPSAAGKAGPLIEEMARRHVRCRSRLAARIEGPSSPFDDATAMRYMIICAEGDPGPQAPDAASMDLAWLAKRCPDAAVRIAAGRIFDPRRPGAVAGHALREIGRARPEGLAAAVLYKAAANRSLATDELLRFVACRIAECTDQEAVLRPLLDALHPGSSAARPALMIRAIVGGGRCGCDLALAVLSHLYTYAQSLGIDVGPAVKKEGDARLKCAAATGLLLNPPPPIDAERAMQSLRLFPALARAIGRDWPRKAAGKAGAPHPLLAWLSWHPHEEIGALIAAPPRESSCGRSRREARLRSGQGPAKHLACLDRSLALLEYAGRPTAGYAKKMKNADQFQDTISEIVLAAAFAGACEFEIDPPVRKKVLDLAITLGGQRIFFEVISPHLWRPLALGVGPRKMRGKRIADKIVDKATGQLPPPGTFQSPIVVAVDTGRAAFECEDIASWMLGSPARAGAACRAADGKAAAGGPAGDAGKRMRGRDARTDTISAVLGFEQDMSADPIGAPRGEVIPNPHAASPLAEAALGKIEAVLRGAPPGRKCARRGTA